MQKLTKKRKKQLLATFALASVLTSNMTTPVLALAQSKQEQDVSTVNPSPKKGEQTTTEEAKKAEKVTESTSSSDDQSVKESEGSKEENVVEQPSVSQTEDPAQKITQEASQLEESDTTLNVTHTTAGSLASEISAMTDHLEDPSLINQFVLNGTAELTADDWTTLNKLSTRLVGVTALTLTDVTSIPANGFSGAKWLKTLLAEKVETIGDNAFSGASNITTLALGIADTTLMATTFIDSITKIESINLPNVIKTPDLASDSEAKAKGFWNFSALKDVELSNVTKIGDRTFRSSVNTVLDTVNAPQVKEIGNEAFSYDGIGWAARPFSNLSGLQTAETIGESAFAENSISTIDLPNVKTIKPRAFQHLKELKDINLSNATDVAVDSFLANDVIQNVTLGITDTTLMATMFKDSITTIESINLPNVTQAPDLSNENEAKEKGFTKFSALKEVQLPEVTDIGSYTFYSEDSNSPLETVNAPKVERIGNYAFYLNVIPSMGSRKFSDLSGLKNVKEIGNYAFFDNSIQSIDLPNTTTVGVLAFSRQGFSATVAGYLGTSLKNVNLPKATTINAYAFQNNNTIESVTLGITDTTILAEMFTDTNLFGDSRQTIKSISLPNVTQTPDLAVGEQESKGFEKFSALKEVQLPNVIDIGDITFSGTPLLETVSAPKVKRIGTFAFDAVSSLKDLSGMKSVEEIDTCAFSGTSIENIDLPKATTVKSKAFYAQTKSSLKTINLPNATDVSPEAFGANTSIKSVTLGITDTTLMATMFKDSITKIESITLPNVTRTPDLSDANGAKEKGFTKFSALKEVQLPEVTDIGDRTFYSEDINSPLETVNAPKVERIGSFAFYLYYVTPGMCSRKFSDLSGLKNVKEIGNEAFFNNSIQSIDFPNVTTVGNKAFAWQGYNQMNKLGDVLKNVNLPKATSIDSETFLANGRIESITLGITDTTLMATMFKDSIKNISSITLPNVTQTPDLSNASDAKTKAFTNFTQLETLSMPKLTTIGDYTFANSKVIPNEVFDHVENDALVPGTAEIIGNNAFYGVKNIPFVQLSNVSSLAKSAFSTSDNKAVLFPEGNLPDSQVNNFFDGNPERLGIVYNNEPSNVTAALNESVKIGESDTHNRFYNEGTAGVTTTFQWTKAGLEEPLQSITPLHEIAHYTKNDAGEYSRAIKMTVAKDASNTVESRYYPVGNYQLDEAPEAPSTPELDALFDTASQITGLTTPNAEVRLTDAQGELKYAVTQADAEGRFTFDLTAPYAAGDKVYVLALNDIGVSDVSQTTVLSGAQKPEVVQPIKGDRVLRGTGKVENTITVISDGQSVGTATVNEKGVYEVALSDPAEAGQTYTVQASTSDMDATDETSCTVEVQDSVGTLNVDSYEVGQTTITGTYEGTIAYAKLIVNDQLVSRGGTFTDDGTFSYYCGSAKIKANDVVVLEAYDQNDQLLDSKTVTVTSATEGTIKQATYKLGTTTITGAYDGQVVKAALIIDGTIVSKGGTFVDGQFTYFVREGVITKDTNAQIQAYDQYESPLGEPQTIDVDQNSGTIKTAVKELTGTTIEGTYEGDVTAAHLIVNGEVVSKGGTFNDDGTYTYYVGKLNLSISDEVSIEALDGSGEVCGDRIPVITNQAAVAVEDLSYVLGNAIITGTYTGEIAQAQLIVDGTIINKGGTFNDDGSFTYYVKSGTLSKDSVASMNFYDQNNNLVLVNQSVTIDEGK